MKTRKGFTIIELLVVIAIIAILAGMLLPALGKARDEARKVKCSSNLKGLAQAMSLYLNKYGGTTMFAVPAHTFRGDCWLATLYWTEIITERKLYLCAGTDDGETLADTQPATLDADAVGAHACSYAGLCHGLTGTLSHRNTGVFTETGLTQASAIASDDDEGAENHSDGMNVVFLDSHVEFKPGQPSDTYDLLGESGTAYEYLDDGE